MAYTLPNLPYSFDALQPYIDEQTMRIHHDKHHGKDGKLAICLTLNEENPLTAGKVDSAGKQLLVVDVWEHAYYLNIRTCARIRRGLVEHRELAQSGRAVQ